LHRLLDGQAVAALAHPPAVVAPALDGVDLLVPPIPDVADQEAPRAIGLPRQPPWVAEAGGVDLRPSVGPIREWVVRRDRVALADAGSEDIQPQHLAVDLPAILRVALFRVARARVARP